MTIRRLLPWLGIAATLASFGGAAAQTSFAPTHAALDTNTLDTGIIPASPDPVPGGLAPMAVDPNQSAARPRTPTPGAAEPPPVKHLAAEEPQEGKQPATATEPVTGDQLRLQLLAEERRVAMKQRAELEEQHQRFRLAKEKAPAEQVEAAREQVELLQAQLAVRKAQYEAAKQAVDSARPALQRAEHKA